jgi:hypothetical protein
MAYDVASSRFPLNRKASDLFLDAGGKEQLLTEQLSKDINNQLRWMLKLPMP